MNVLQDGVRVLKFINREDKIPAYNAIMGRIVKKEYSYTRNTLAATRKNGPCVIEMHRSHSYYQAPIETVKHINVIYNWLLNKIKEINAQRVIEADARIKAERERIDAICFK